MGNLEIYEPSFENKDIIKSLKKIGNGEPLPESGPTGFFYQNVKNPGETLYLHSGNKIRFFYVDHDDFIQEISSQEPGWSFDINQNMAWLTLFYKDNGSAVPLNFNFDLGKGEYREAIRILGKKKKFHLTLISMVYGSFVKETSNVFNLPDSIVKAIKRI